VLHSSIFLQDRCPWQEGIMDLPLVYPCFMSLPCQQCSASNCSFTDPQKWKSLYSRSRQNSGWARHSQHSPGKLWRAIWSSQVILNMFTGHGMTLNALQHVMEVTWPAQRDSNPWQHLSFHSANSGDFTGSILLVHHSAMMMRWKLRWASGCIYQALISALLGLNVWFVEGHCLM
jgi:hypothetical protein